MSKHSIMNVPRYFVPYTNDCFQNAYGSVISYLELKPELLLADYLSFVYDPKSGYAGMNYLQKEGTSVEFTEEELNCSLEYVYFPTTTIFSQRKGQQTKNIQNDQIKITWYIEDDENIAYLRMKELIDMEMPVVVVVDLYYIKYHKAYQKEHGLHAVVVTGYNEEENYVEIFDKYRFSSCDFDGKFPIDELILARNSKNCSGRYNRPIRNLWMEFSGNKQFVYNEKRWREILEESCRRMYGEKDILGCKCGLDSLEAFRRDLAAKREGEMDQAMLDYFKYYYSAIFRSLSRSRIRFNEFLIALDSKLPEELVTEVTSLLKESSKGWEINANLSIRLAITKNINAIDNLSEQIKAIWDYESLAVEKLHKYIKSR
jgi:hypothetical protein